MNKISRYILIFCCVGNPMFSMDIPFDEEQPDADYVSETIFTDRDYEAHAPIVFQGKKTQLKGSTLVIATRTNNYWSYNTKSKRLHCGIARQFSDLPYGGYQNHSFNDPNTHIVALNRGWSSNIVALTSSNLAIVNSFDRKLGPNELAIQGTHIRDAYRKSQTHDHMVTNIKGWEVRRTHDHKGISITYPYDPRWEGERQMVNIPNLHTVPIMSFDINDEGYIATSDCKGTVRVTRLKDKEQEDHPQEYNAASMSNKITAVATVGVIVSAAILFGYWLGIRK